MVFRSKRLRDIKLTETIKENNLEMVNKNYLSWDSLSYKDKKTLDGMSNKIANLGQNTNNLLNFTEYERNPITADYRLLNNLYRDNWVVQNIIQTVPNDITKKWFKIKTKLNPAYFEKINRLYRRTSLIDNVNEGMAWGRLFGGAIGIILIKGQENNLEEPLDYNLIGIDSFRGLYILDRWAGVDPSNDLIDDISSSDFGLPEYYTINDDNIGFHAKVHHSKVIRFINRKLPLYERIREQYWGVSEIESLYRDLIRRDNTAENISSLVFKANLSVMKIKDLNQIFSLNSIQAQNRFWELLGNITEVESSLGVKVIDSEDEAQFLNYSFSGIKDIYEALMLDLSGASRIPVTKLFGRSPAGMNATGESDMQNYYEFIDDVRESIFKRIVLKLLPIIALSSWGNIPDDLDFEFPSMNELDEERQSTVLQQKAGTIMEAFNSNLITQDIAQKELKSLSETFGVFDNIEDELIEKSKGKFASELQGMNDPMAGLMGGAGELPQINEEPPNPNDSEELIEDSEDDFEKSLLAIKNRLLQDKEPINYNKLEDIDFFDKTVDEDKDLLINEYKELDELYNKAKKDYERALQTIYSYSSELDIPEKYINEFNKFKHKYYNILKSKKKLRDRIKQNGYGQDLVIIDGTWESALKEVEKQFNSLKKQAEDKIEKQKENQYQRKLINVKLQ